MKKTADTLKRIDTCDKIVSFVWAVMLMVVIFCPIDHYKKGTALGLISVIVLIYYSHINYKYRKIINEHFIRE